MVRRRILLIYLVLLAVSHAVQLARPFSGEPEASPAVEIPAMRGAGPLPGRRVRVAYREWPADAGAAARFASPAGLSKEPERGFPVVLLHGSPGSASNFDRLGPELAAAGRRVVAPDLPGFGGSSAWVPSYSSRAHARAVLALMDELGIGRVHVVGWSNGGAVALHMADIVQHEWDRSPDRSGAGGSPGSPLASLTMLAATGAQETEGSGSWFFEHVKYAVGYAGLVVLPEFVPHFGLLGPRESRHAFIRNFWDSDQRPLRAVMERLSVPTLILHGRRDPLVSDWAAERHHEIIPRSRLVMTPYSHFMPFMQPRETAGYIGEFIDEAEGSGQPDPVGAIILAERSLPLGPAWDGLESLVRPAPWWLEVLLVAALALWRRHVAAAVAAVFVARSVLDLGVATAGVFLGTLAESYALWFIGRRFGHNAAAWRWVRARVGRVSETDWRRRFSRGPARVAFAARFKPWMRCEASFAAGVLRRRDAAVRRDSGRRAPDALPLARTMPVVLAGTFLSSFYVVLLARALAALALWPLVHAAGWAGLVVGAWLLARVARGGELVLTWTGRRRLVAWVTRVVRYEYWPAAVFYIPVLFYSLWLGVRHRGLMLPSCCNPAISGGGGIVGESKALILDNLAHANGRVLAGALVPEGGTAQERALHVHRLLRERPDLGGLPVILKPDQGQRGHGVRLARTHDDVLAYFQAASGATLVQRYHPGPCECGVLWMRGTPNVPRVDRGRWHGQPVTGRPIVEEPSTAPSTRGTTGFIYSVTRKDFPSLRGDGRRTLEQLIYRHPRLRCQADAFLWRFADERTRVPGAGETLRLAESGNHCQGTLFRDGADLITPALEEAIDRIARGFPAGADGGGGGLDAGRFDVRYETDEGLRRGEGFAIVELNGTAGESTNLYDPDRSLLWAYRVLLGQVRAMYELGAARRDAGARPMSALRLWREARAHFRARSGSSVAD